MMRTILQWLEAPHLGWQRRLAAYIFVCAGFALCLVLIHHNGTHDRDRDRRRFIQQAHLHCLERVGNREVLRSVVALLDDEVDYSHLPSFAALDPATQRFLTEVAASTSASDQFRERALQALPPITCP